MFIMLTSSSTKKNVLVKVDRIITAIKPQNSLTTRVQISLGEKASVIEVIETPEQIHKEVKKGQSDA